MASGNFSSSSINGLSLYVEWSSTKNVSANTSSVTARLYVKSYGFRASALSGSYLTINGNTKNWTKTFNIDDTSTLKSTQVAEYTVTVPHNSDGTKSITIKANMKLNGTYGGTYISDLTASKSVKLDTIPRSSSFFVPSSVNTGSSLAITITPSNSSFRHRFRFEIDGESKYTSGYVAAGTTSYSYTIPHSWLPKATSKKMTVYCYTYPSSGDNYIAKVSKTVTANVPSNIKPSISEFTAAVSSGLNDKYIQGKSKVKLVATAKTSSGSTISSYIFKGANISGTASSYTVTSALTSYTRTSSVIQSSGTLTYKVAVKDARGRISDYKSVSIKVYAYATPQITSISAQRCLADGTLHNDGTYAKVTVKTSYVTIDGANTRTVKLYSSKDDYATGTTVLATSNTSGTYTGVYSSGFETNKTYTIKATITDKYGNHSKSATLRVAERTLNVAKYGNGVAIGGLSTVTSSTASGLFESHWKTNINNNMNVTGNITIGGDIGCTEAYNGSNFAMYCQWKDQANHDILVRNNDGLTMGLGWKGDDNNKTVLDVRPQEVNMRGTMTVPRARFTATTDAEVGAQTDVAVRIGSDSGQHIDIDSNEIIAKDAPTTLGSLSFGGSSINMYINEVATFIAGKDDTSEFVRSVPTYERTYDASPNVYITSAGTFGRGTSSSQRYKTAIKNVEDSSLDPYNVLDIPVRQFKYNKDNIPVNKKADDLYIGFIAEEVEKAYPAAAEYNEDGQVEMWNIKVIVPAMLKILQDQQKEIENLKEQLNNIN